jgi:hypothetical protein
MIFNSRVVGAIKLKHLEMLVCANKHTENDSKFLTPNAAAYVAGKIRSIETEKISKLPISEFVDTAEAAEILGTTGRNMAVLVRTRHNLFVTYRVGSRTLLYRKSILEYKATGDGCVLICKGV